MVALSSEKLQLEFLQSIFEKEDQLFQPSEEETEEIASMSMLRDILLDCVKFVYNEGLMEHNMKYFVRFFYDLLQETVFQELTIEKVVSHIKEKVQDLTATGMFKELFLKASVDFICQNLVQHYHLYVCALCYERELQLHACCELVTAPPYDYTELVQAKPIDVWEMETKIQKQTEELQSQEKALNQTMALTLAGTTTELENLLIDLEDAWPDTINVSDISELIKSIIGRHSDLTATELDGALERSKLVVMNKLEKVKIRSKTTTGTNKSNSKLNVSVKASKSGRKSSRKK